MALKLTRERIPPYHLSRRVAFSLILFSIFCLITDTTSALTPLAPKPEQESEVPVRYAPSVRLRPLHTHRLNAGHSLERARWVDALIAFRVKAKP